ncbi:MAG: vWA domain-containing protein [Acidobacteriota bacterium]
MNTAGQSSKEAAFQKSSIVGNYLNMYFAQGQGVRLGESSVVSLKAHRLESGRKGHVKILVNRDAGQHFLEYIDPGQIVHLDTFHTSGAINPREAAIKIFQAVLRYVEEEEAKPSFGHDEIFDIAVDYALKIMVVCGGEKGLVYDLFQGITETVDSEQYSNNHVRILAKLNSNNYGIILAIAEAVEEAIVDAGLELAKVRRISNTRDKDTDYNLTKFLTLPWNKKSSTSSRTLKENRIHLVLKLADIFGTLGQVQEFLESNTANIFKRMSQEEKKRKWGDLEQYLQQLKQLGLLKSSILGPVLTQEGKDLNKYLIDHKCELEAELRRNIRRHHGRESRGRERANPNRKVSKVDFINRNKVIRINDNSWPGNLALSETIICAKKSSLLRQENRLSIRKQDLHIYSKKSHVPVDICLLVDASLSMAGEKRQAANHLAKYLLLSSKDKVAVVTFQETRARVEVPFTRNQQILDKGLANIKPGGMTPLADGIVASLELLKASKVENPILILITDGMPNFPLWSFDAKKDALEAAKKIVQTKIRFVCVGVDSNREFLKDLADCANGRLYLVDDLNRKNLIEVVRYEKKFASLIPTKS